MKKIMGCVELGKWFGDHSSAAVEEYDCKGEGQVDKIHISCQPMIKLPTNYGFNKLFLK